VQESRKRQKMESLGGFIAPFPDKAEAPPRHHRPCAGDLDV
jgi:hypothetical protein